MRLIIIMLAMFSFVLPARAADEVRKVDFTKVLTDQDDQPIKECADDPQPKDLRDCREHRPVTLGMVSLRALVIPEQGLSPEDSVKRGALGLSLYKATAVEVSPEDVVLLKKQISKAYGPLIAVRAARLLDPTVK